MRLPDPNALPGRPSPRDWHARASVLIIVLWVVFGLVVLTLYFAQSMAFQFRAADNRVASLQAGQAIDGAVRYVTNLVGYLGTNGALPDATQFESEAVPLGDAKFWLIGRDTNLWQHSLTRPTFGLVDEASKLNLNTATREMLEALPLMTAEFAAAIIDWRDTDSEPTENGAEDDYYARADPPYRAKNAPFETIEELRLVAGCTLQILFGEDTNLNGILDPNEDDGEDSFPTDNQDGRLDAGILEYVTVGTSEPNIRADGSPRLNLGDSNQTNLVQFLRERLGAQRANQIVPGLGNSGALTARSVLGFCLLAGLTTEEITGISDDLTVTNATTLVGLINVNTASTEVLTCVPGIGIENAQTVVAARDSNVTPTSLAWIIDALGRENTIAAAPFLTTRTYQFTADIAALGRHDRGYQRVRFLIDVTGATPRIRARRDLSHLGWALGREVRDELKLLASQSP